MRYSKKELIELLEDEEDDSIIVFEYNGKEIYISNVECSNDGLVCIIM